jgi:hypothetical protein
VEESDFASAVELFGGKAGDSKLYSEAELKGPARQANNDDDDDDDDDDGDANGKGKASATAKPAKAGAAAVDTSSENPKTEQEFVKYASLVSQSILRHRDSPFYYALVLNVVKTALAERPITEMSELGSTLAKLAADKTKKEKEAADSKKKAKNAAKTAKKKLASDFVEDDIDRYGARYEDDFDF